MERTHLILAAVAAVCLAGVAAPAVGHPSHIGITSQSSPDGTVVVGSVFSIDTGFLVLYTDDGGDLGEPIGHAKIENGVQTGIEIDVYADAWSDWNGPTRVWATIHRDENDDGEFDPDDDPVVTEAGSFVGTAFHVDRSDQGRSVVTAGSTAPRLVDSPTATVPRAAIETDGHLALHADDDGRPGDVVGHTSLEAGDHRNVTVDLDEEYFAERNGTFRLHAVLYEDDGDGEFDAGSDPQVRVADEPVSAPLDLRKVDDADGDVVVTASETASTTVETVADDTDGGLPTPGFGLAAGVVAILAAVLVLARRRREDA